MYSIYNYTFNNLILIKKSTVSKTANDPQKLLYLLSALTNSQYTNTFKSKYRCICFSTDL